MIWFGGGVCAGTLRETLMHFSALALHFLPDVGDVMKANWISQTRSLRAGRLGSGVIGNSGRVGSSWDFTQYQSWKF